MNPIQAIKAVQVFQDKTWIPKEFKGYTYFSVSDVWHYISISDDRRCQYCKEFDGGDFFGDQIRFFFPDLIIRSKNVIDVHIHKTLWNKDTCRCKLVRVHLSEEAKAGIEEPNLSPYLKKKIEEN